MHEENNLLYHRAIIGGLQLDRLLVPMSKRLEVMQTAHDSIFSSHFGVDKTIKRIKSHFYWPSLIIDAQAYVSSCSSCQKHKRRTKYDRTPIEAVPRANHVFQHVYVDLIGPLEPKSSKNHGYILCLIDNY